MKDVAKSSLSSIKIKWISTKRKKTRDCLYLKISSRRSHLHPQTTILSSRRLLCALKHNQSDIQVHCSADLQHNTIERLHVNNHLYLFPMVIHTHFGFRRLWNIFCHYTFVISRSVDSH